MNNKLMSQCNIRALMAVAGRERTGDVQKEYAFLQLLLCLAVSAKQASGQMSTGKDQ